MKTLTKLTLAVCSLGFSTLALAGDAAKAPATPAKGEPAKAAPKMEAPKPPQELAEMAKMVTGTWKCTGKAAMDPKDPTAMMDMKVTEKFALDTGLGGWWIKSNMDGGMFKMESYITFDPTAKKWIGIDRDNMGGSTMKSSDGMKDNKIVWMGDARSSDAKMPAMKVRETHDMSDMKTGAKLLGEMSMDGGKTWMKGWEATCKK